MKSFEVWLLIVFRQETAMLRGNGRDLFFAKCIAVIHLGVSILLAVAVALFIASYNKENGRKLFWGKTI